MQEGITVETWTRKRDWRTRAATMARAAIWFRRRRPSLTSSISLPIRARPWFSVGRI